MEIATLGSTGINAWDKAKRYCTEDAWDKAKMYCTEDAGLKTQVVAHGSLIPQIPSQPLQALPTWK